MNNNNPQACEGGGGGKDFARALTELMTRERRKNYRENTSMYLLNPETALKPNWLDLLYLVQPDLASHHVSIMPCHKLHYVCHNVYFFIYLLTCF